MKRIPSFIVCVTLLVGLAGTQSCQKFTDTPPFFEQPDSLKVTPARKVLIIGIDGLPAGVFKTIAPPKITAMEAHGKYSFEAGSDEISTSAASWKTLISGASFSKHQIRDSSFVYETTEIEGSGTANYYKPSLFANILRTTKPDLLTRFVTSWPQLIPGVAPEVGKKIITAGDVATKDSVVKALQTANDDIIVAQFGDPARAGRAGSFSATDNGYRQAVLQTDTYIGDIMTALKARPKYNKEEEWLVIITGTHGGNGSSFGGSSANETTVFQMFYNEKFLPKELKKPPFTGVVITGKDASTINGKVLNDGGLYDIGTGQQTVQIRIKGSNPGSYPHFFGKLDKFVGNGWTMFTAGGNWSLSIKSTTSGEKRLQDTNPTVFDGTWHTISFCVYDSASSRWVKRFSDGLRINDANRQLGSTYGSITTPAPLRLGWGADGYGPVTFTAADIRIFNTVLTDDEIRNNLCLTDITQHPKYANLIGYWPGTEGFGGRMNNFAPGKAAYPFSLSGPFSWTGDNIIPCNIIPTPLAANQAPVLLSNSGITRTLFYWLRLPVPGSWGLEGSNWLAPYETEFVTQ